MLHFGFKASENKNINSIIEYKNSKTDNICELDYIWLLFCYSSNIRKFIKSYGTNEIPRALA